MYKVCHPTQNLMRYIAVFFGSFDEAAAYALCGFYLFHVEAARSSKKLVMIPNCRLHPQHSLWCSFQPYPPFFYPLPPTLPAKMSSRMRPEQRKLWWGWGVRGRKWLNRWSVCLNKLLVGGGRTLILELTPLLAQALKMAAPLVKSKSQHCCVRRDTLHKHGQWWYLLASQCFQLSHHKFSSLLYKPILVLLQCKIFFCLVWSSLAMFGVDFSGLVFVWLKQVWQMLLSTSSDFKILNPYTAERRDVKPSTSWLEAVYGPRPFSRH